MADITAARVTIERHLRVEEGEKLKPYLCPAGKPTIGVGCTYYEDGRKVTLSDPQITIERSAALLRWHVDHAIDDVLDMTHNVCTTNQLIALVVCGFNIGFPGLRGSSMIKAHNAGNYAAAAGNFRQWNKYTPKGSTQKVVHPVLDARRLREAAVYSTPDDQAAAPPPVPQAVEPPSTMTQSPINRAGATTIAGGLAWLGSQFEQLQPIVDQGKHLLVDTLGLPPRFLVVATAAIVIYAGARIIYWRVKQRREGWA